MRAVVILVVLVIAAAGGAMLGKSRDEGVRGSATVSVVPSCRLAPTDAAHPGMVWVPGGAFTMGSDQAFPEEAPTQRTVVDGFWMDQTEVTNAQFAEFVAATGYRTLAERGIPLSTDPGAETVRGSAVFRPRGNPDDLRSAFNWWQFQDDADWRHPGGPGTSIKGLEQHPVVHVTYEDALAYAKWKGRSLPTEEQFEFAAQGTGRRNAEGQYTANSWQGTFPSHDTAADGFAGTAPVGCYEANRLGLHDLIGNVWEWTTSPYFERHDFRDKAAHPEGFDPTQPEEKAVGVLKGGSYLCSPDYCMRYRPEARIGQSRGLGAAHIGFRTVLIAPK